MQSDPVFRVSSKFIPSMLRHLRLEHRCGQSVATQNSKLQQLFTIQHKPLVEMRGLRTPLALLATITAGQPFDLNGPHLSFVLFASEIGHGFRPNIQIRHSQSVQEDHGQLGVGLLSA